MFTMAATDRNSLATLRKSLAGLIRWGDLLANGLRLVDASIAAQEPPTAKDYKLAASSDSLYDLRFFNAWPKHLRPLYRNLREWWQCFYDAQEALDCLAATDSLHDLRRQVRQALSDVAAWFYHTGPRQSPIGDDVDVMMLVTNLGDMPKNWQIQLRQLCEYDAELKAIQNDMRIRDDAIAQTKAKAADDRIETYGDNYSRDTWLVKKRTSLSLPRLEAELEKKAAEKHWTPTGEKGIDKAIRHYCLFFKIDMPKARRGRLPKNP
jgi:hypothetical protein